MVLLRWMISLVGGACVGSAVASADSADSVWTMGVVANRPVALSVSTFPRAIEDPANPFWLLKFYAPWCGHCKRMVPVLEKVAPQVAGKMSIGKIDCTTDKKLCNEFQVRGYPTLKFSIDGVVNDYSGGRSESDFLLFAKKMTGPVLTAVHSVTKALEYAHKESETGVVFLAMDPKLRSHTPPVGQDVSSATLLTQVLAKVARKYRVSAEFLVLVPDETTTETDASLPSSELASTLAANGESPYICRVERFVPVKCFPGFLGSEDGDESSSTGSINSVELSDFIKVHHVATVSQLGPSNFQAMSRKGRPLVIGVVRRRGRDETQQVDAMEEALVKMATAEPYSSKYYFGWMDGGQFYRFLEQFTIDKDSDLPIVFVLDQVNQVFWKNSTYFTGSLSSLEESTKMFLNHVQDGTIPEQVTKAGAKGWKRVLNRFVSAMNENHPWSIVLFVLVLIAFALAIAVLVSPGGDEPMKPLPPLPKKTKPKDEVDDQQPSTAAVPAVEAEESKKDK